MHFVVLIWGFTGILGGLINLDSYEITFFRTGIAFLSLLLIGFFIRQTKKLSKKEALQLLVTGIIVGLHWITFFYSIKISTVSIAVVCMSASTLFTSILEPIIFKRKYFLSEFLLSIAVSTGVVIIFGFEIKYATGIALGLLSAFFAALFNTLNGSFVQTISSRLIAQYEMLGGFLTAGFFLLFTGRLTIETFKIPTQDWVYLLLLALICTSFAFIVSVWVMKFVTPFTVSISVNMEPVYTIIIALIIDWQMGTDKEKMSEGFYLGGAIIILSILVHAYLKAKKKPLQTLL